jgi:hypothetical protein
MKLACFGDTSAVPSRRPRQPASSTRRPAASSGGFVNTEPAFWPPGWCSRRQRTISATSALAASASPGVTANVASTTTAVGARPERR